MMMNVAVRTSLSLGLLGACLLGAGLLGACDEAEHSPQGAKEAVHESQPSTKQAVQKADSLAEASGATSVPERTSEELSLGLRNACEQAAVQKKRLLIEFSAPWCGDCRRLAQMEEEPALKRALAKFPHYSVNVGQFDRHEELLKRFSVRAIAAWQIVETDDCQKAPGQWTRVARRTLEPQTGKSKLTAQDLASWLERRIMR